MRNKLSSIQLAVAAIVTSLLLANCTTTYDPYGRPVQSVDPVAATAAAVVVGAIAYSAGKNNRRNYDKRDYYRPHHHRRGYRGHY